MSYKNIHLINILMAVDFEIVRIMAKPCVLQTIYFTNYVQNSLHCKMVIIIFDLRGYGVY